MCLIGYPDYSLYRLVASGMRARSVAHKNEAQQALDHDKDMALLDQMKFRMVQDAPQLQLMRSGEVN